MKLNFWRFFSCILVVVMVAVCNVVPAFAVAGNGVDYTAQAGSTMTFNKYLIVSAGDKVPASEFSFKIEAGSAIPASAGKMAVLAGIGTPTVSKAIFVSDQSTSSSATASQIDVQRADRTNVKWESGKGEKFAVTDVTVDFSSVSFTEPGVYRYIVTENVNADNSSRGIVQDDDTDRVLDVYVTDSGSGTLVVSQYVLHKDVGDVVAGTNMGSADVSSDRASLSDKTDGFTNEYKSGDLSFKKEVDGNQASHDKYFEFTVKVTGLADTDKYVVSLSDDGDVNTNDGSASSVSGTNDATISANAGKTNPMEVTGAQLASGVKYYLMHGQYVVVRGLPAGASYEITENAEDYKSEAKTVTGYTDNTSGIISSGDLIKTSYKNIRNGIIPTGILMTIVPYIAVLVIGVGAIVFFLVSKKHKSNND